MAEHNTSGGGTNGRVSGVWKWIAISAVSINITLLGAWATHSLTREEFLREQESQSVLIGQRIDVIAANQRTKMDDVVELKVKVERLSAEVEELKQQIRRTSR